MKSKRLFSALGNIDDRFINEDAEVITAPKDRGSERPITAAWLKLAVPVAACLVIAMGVLIGQNALFAPPDVGGDGSLFAQPEQTDLATAETPFVPQPTEAPYLPPADTVPLSVININELSEISAARLAIDLLPEDFVPMDKNEIIDFYGFDFFPSTIPADMKIVEEDSYGIYKKDEGSGAVYYSANLAWYVDDDINRQLQVNIDKGEIPNSCFIYLSLWHEKSLIDGTELLIGRSVDHSGTERFVAEIMYAGNGLRIESSNLSQTEFVDAISSLIRGL